MSSLWQPVGSQPPHVYWIRRGIVAVVVLLVLWLGWLTIRALLPNQESQVPEAGASPSQAAEPPRDSEAEGSAANTREGASMPGSTFNPDDSSKPNNPSNPDNPSNSDSTSKPEETSSPGADQPESNDSEGTAACSESSVELGLTGSTKRPTGGNPLTFEVSVTNKSTAECTVDLNPESLELKVISGSDRVWTSKHCDSWISATSKKLKPQQTLKMNLTWPGRRSADGCKIKSETLFSGTYVATAQLGTTRSPKYVMRLRKG